MTLTYFDHDADMGIIGRGMTVEQSFEAAAQAVFAIITNLETVQPSDGTGRTCTPGCVSSPKSMY